MNNLDMMDTWVNYALVVRIPFNDIQKFKDFCKENDIKVIYAKASLKHLIVSEELPSEAKDGEE